ADGPRPGRGGRRDAGEVRGLLRALPRLRPRKVDHRHPAGAARPPAAGPGAHPRPGERQGPLHPRRARAVPGLRAGGAARGRAPADARPEEELDHAVRQIISRAVAPEGVVDIFAAAGLEKPDISILSDEFLAEVRGMPQRNLAVELLQKLLKGELKTRRRKNVV